MNCFRKRVRRAFSSLLPVMVASLLSIGAVESAPKQRLHRAYEPASIQLDINLQENSLSLFISMSSEAVTAITTKTVHSLVDQLNEFTPLAVLPEDADCKQTQKQFISESAILPSMNTEPHPQSTTSQQVTGYLEYECESPENLSHLKFRGFKAIPGLKHASVWLISDNWQSKQQLNQKQKVIQLQKKRRLIHFLLELFTD